MKKYLLLFLILCCPSSVFAKEIQKILTVAAIFPSEKIAESSSSQTQKIKRTSEKRNLEELRRWAVFSAIYSEDYNPFFNLYNKQNDTDELLEGLTPDNPFEDNSVSMYIGFHRFARKRIRSAYRKFVRQDLKQISQYGSEEEIEYLNKGIHQKKIPQIADWPAYYQRFQRPVTLRIIGEQNTFLRMGGLSFSNDGKVRFNPENFFIPINTDYSPIEDQTSFFPVHIQASFKWKPKLSFDSGWDENITRWNSKLWVIFRDRSSGKDYLELELQVKGKYDSFVATIEVKVLHF